MAAHVVPVEPDVDDGAVEVDGDQAHPVVGDGGGEAGRGAHRRAAAHGVFITRGVPVIPAVL